jgi:hypothetical protein
VINREFVQRLGAVSNFSKAWRTGPRSAVVEGLAGSRQTIKSGEFFSNILGK